MANMAASWENALNLGLQLPVKERLKLVERLIESVETELPVTVDADTDSETWGQRVVRLVKELGSIDLDYPEITDPVEWVKRIRQDQAEHRNLDWGEEGFLSGETQVIEPY